MAKKLKRRAGGKTDGELAAAIKNSANQIWLAGLGAFAKAQEEGTKAFETLMKEGEKVQQRVMKTAQKAQADGTKFFESLVKEGEKVQNRASKAAGDTLADARAQATGAWGKLENVFQARVAQALHAMSVPTKQDIDKLGRRVADLTAATKKMSGSTKRSQHKVHSA
ncbi:MAG: phasin family protein [Rhizomicrobium sp.]